MLHKGLRKGRPVCSKCGATTSYSLDVPLRVALTVGFYLVAFCDDCEEEIGQGDLGVMSVCDGAKGPLVNFPFVTSLMGGPIQ